MESYKVLVVILAIFLHRGNCRVITPHSNDGFENILGVVDEEINTILSEGNEEHARQEKPDPTRLEESDIQSHEGLQFASEHVSGEGSDDVTPSTEGIPMWRQKRSPDDEPSCYTGSYMSVTLPNNNTVSVPICKRVTSVGVACVSSMANNNNQRKCVPSDYITEAGKAYPRRCSCAP